MIQKLSGLNNLRSIGNENICKVQLKIPPIAENIESCLNVSMDGHLMIFPINKLSQRLVNHELMGRRNPVGGINFHLKTKRTNDVPE